MSGYSLGFENPATFEFEDLFTDIDQVRISNLEANAHYNELNPIMFLNTF